MTKAAQQSVTKIISLAPLNLITPKAGAKHEHLFNQLASEAGLLNKCLCLALALGVTKLIAIVTVNSVTLCCAT